MTQPTPLSTVLTGRDRTGGDRPEIRRDRDQALAQASDVTIAVGQSRSHDDQPRRWPDRHLYSTLILVSLVLNLGAAWYLSNIAQIGNADGLSRTANAWYVIFSRDPHLSAIGFVWPILPSLVQIPLLPLVRPLGSPELAGWLMSSMSGAATLAVLAAILG